jgi:stage II sporulation protein E
MDKCMRDIYIKRLTGYAESFKELSEDFSQLKTLQTGSREQRLRAQIINDNRVAVSDSMTAAAGVMAHAARELTGYEPMDKRRRKMLVNAFADEGIEISDIYCISDYTDRLILGVSLCIKNSKKRNRQKERSISASEIADMLSVLLKRQLRLSVSSPLCVDSMEKTFVFVEEPPFVVLTGFARAVKDNETLSGDNYSIVESEKGRIKLILSDGTGSGKEANDGSGRVLDMLEKMLDTGYDVEPAIRIMNTVLFSESRELNHPTLDLCELDLYRGECEFYKAGAAASFIKSGNEVRSVEGDSLPLGVMCLQDISREETELKSGDYIVMMSDGVLDALNEQNYEETMKQVISAIDAENPDIIAEQIMHAVLCMDGGQIRDDMTVLVAGIWRNQSI